MARIQWKEDSVVSLKLRDDLYTICLLKKSPYAWFFDLHNTSGEWKQINLNSVRPLFCVIIASPVVFKNLAVGKVSSSDVVPPVSLPIPAKWIDPKLNTANREVDTFAWRGGKLVDLKPGPNMLDSPVLIEDLDIRRDRDLIESCELTNMWGDKDLGDRLCRYFDTGIDRDDLKFEVFRGLWDDREKLRPLTRRLPVPMR